MNTNPAPMPKQDGYRLPAQNPFSPVCIWPVDDAGAGVHPCGEKVFTELSLEGYQLCYNHAMSIWARADAHLREEDMLVYMRKEYRAEQKREGKVKPKPAEGYIYYLRVGGHIKIGYASNLEKRLASYPPDVDLLAVEPGTMKDERQLHRTFRPMLISGREWFEPRPVLMDHIDRVAQNKRHTWWDDEEWRRRDPSSDHVVKPKNWRG